VNRVRAAILGPSTAIPDFKSSDRFWSSRAEHEALQMFRRSLDSGPGRYPIVVQPKGSIYSHPNAGLLIRCFGMTARSWDCAWGF
jgi:hypothetical protein